MYTCKTYGGEMRRYLKSIDTYTLVDVFLAHVNSEYLLKSAIDYFSNPHDFTISELEELFAE